VENKPSPAYYAAVVVINNDGQVLLGKRKEDGIWTTPGGSAEPHESNPPKTAARELFEEAGIPADHRFLQPIGSIATRNGKFCHTFLYVTHSGVMVTSKLDPDQEVGNWKWFHMNELPNSLKDDPRRFESVRNGYMKFHGISKSLTESLEKGGKPAQIGEVRNFGGTDYQKMGNGDWRPVVHPEEKKINEIQSKEKKEKTPVQKLTDKLEDKNTVTMAEKHMHDLKNGAVVEGKKTRSGKPVFTTVDGALANGYTAEEFREVGNMFYDRAEQLKKLIDRAEQSGSKTEQTFVKIVKMNSQLGKQFIRQGNIISDRQAKTEKMKKSTVHMGHNDAASINTADYAMEHKQSLESEWLERLQNVMEGYAYGEVPRIVMMDKGDLYLVKVEDGLYSGIFKTITPVEDGVLEENAKVRIERMTLPSIVQFCLAKEWIRDLRDVTPEPAQVEHLIHALEAPANPIIPVESELDKKIKLVGLMAKLLS
jgi:8-oxo-dGTP pyrophosphatase MutT (NUDIX family)